MQHFLVQMEGHFRKHALWRDARPQDIASALEGLEKYIMIKLYDLTFGISAEDKERDALLSAKMGALAFVKPSNLEIPPSQWDEGAWAVAQKELQRVNQYKAPGDKIICIMNCCRVLNNLLEAASKSSAPPGADDFFPLLVYTILRANPPRLESNLQFIHRFRKADQLVSETSYFLTTFVSAASFLETLDATSLVGVDPAHFLRSMREAGFPVTEEALVHAEQKQMEQEQTPLNPRPPHGEVQQTETGSILPLPTLEELLCWGQELVTGKEQEGNLAPYQYLYARAEDLRVGDVEPLLTTYKEVVLQYECLCCAYEEMRRLRSNAQGRQGEDKDPLSHDESTSKGIHVRAVTGSSHPIGTPTQGTDHQLAEALGPLALDSHPSRSTTCTDTMSQFLDGAPSDPAQPSRNAKEEDPPSLLD